MKGIYILFDGSNLITKRNSKKDKIAFQKDLKSIQEFCSNFTKIFKDINPIIFVDSTLKYIIDKKKWLVQQLNTWRIFQSEKGHEVDEYLLGSLRIAPLRVIIVSYDKFRDHKEKIPELCKGLKWRFSGIIRNNKLIVPGLESLLENLLILKKQYVLPVEYINNQEFTECLEFY